MALILILDDRATNRNIYARLAAAIEPGIVAEVFADPLDSLEWLQANRVDLIITDYRMPGMDGAEFTRRFRAMPHGSLAPVLVVTAYDDRSFRLRALDAGATDFLQTPIDHFELVTRARNLLALGRRATPPAPGIIPAPERPRAGGADPFNATGRAPVIPPAIPPNPRRAASAAARPGIHHQAHGVPAEQSLADGSPNVAPDLSACELARILDGMPAMVSVADRSGTCLYVNAALAGWIGRPAATLIGRPAGLFHPPEHATRSRQDDLTVFDAGHTPPTTLTTAGPDGVLRILHTLKTPLRDAAGGTVAVLTVTFDLPGAATPPEPPWGVADG